MSESFQWRPIQVFSLDETLRFKALGSLRVGGPIVQVESLLGATEYPRSRIGRSRVWELQYGNVSVLVSTQVIVGISIDFHCNRVETVRSGACGNWGVREWEKYAVGEGLDLVREHGIITLKGGGLLIALTSIGQLEMVSLG